MLQHPGRKLQARGHMALKSISPRALRRKHWPQIHRQTAAVQCQPLTQLMR